TGVSRPDFREGHADAIVVALRPRLAAKSLFLVIDGHWFHDSLDDALLAAHIRRHPIMANRVPNRNANPVARFERGLLSEGPHHLRLDLLGSRHGQPLSLIRFEHLTGRRRLPPQVNADSCGPSSGC